MRKTLLKLVAHIVRTPQPSQNEIVRGCDNLVPVRQASKRASALSKAGRFVVRGNREGRPIKLFESNGIEHAQFILAVSSHRLLADYFPRVHALHGAFVITEWVSSVKRAKVSSEELVALQRLIHEISPAELPAAGFNYWDDLVRPRFTKASMLLGEEELCERIVGAVSGIWNGERQYLMHPDLTPANVVLGEAGIWQIVDNELITLGGLPLLDVCNTSHALGKNVGQRYADQYLQLAGIELTESDVDILQKAWLARMVGSAFVAGDIQRALGVVRQYKAGVNILPFLPS